MDERDPLSEDPFSRLDVSRRELVRRLIAGTAFAIPVVASFDMAALSTPASALTPNQVGAGTPNQARLAPTISSGSQAALQVGVAGSFQITATGAPLPSIEYTGTLPAGVTLSDSANGRATLAGTPEANSGGVYDLEITASNGVSPNGSQAFMLTVDEPPAIVSSDKAAFTVGRSGEAALLTTGYPAAALALAGALPAGLHFGADHRDGSAAIGGTPAAGTAGSRQLQVTASNGITPDAMQSLSLTIAPAPKTAPDNHFTVTRIRVASDGTVSFLATVPGPGVLDTHETTKGGATFARGQTVARAAGPLSARVTPTPAGQRLVRQHPGRVTIKLVVTYTPTGGSAHTVDVGSFQVPGP